MTNREKMRQSIINIFNAHKDWSDDELARNMSLEGASCEVYRRVARVLGYNGLWFEEDRLTEWLGRDFNPDEPRCNGLGRR